MTHRYRLSRTSVAHVTTSANFYAGFGRTLPGRVPDRGDGVLLVRRADQGQEFRRAGRDAETRSDRSAAGHGSRSLAARTGAAVIDRIAGGGCGVGCTGYARETGDQPAGKKSPSTSECINPPRTRAAGTARRTSRLWLGVVQWTLVGLTNSAADFQQSGVQARLPHRSSAVLPVSRLRPGLIKTGAQLPIRQHGFNVGLADFDQMLLSAMRAVRTDGRKPDLRQGVRIDLKTQREAFASRGTHRR